MKFDHSSMRYLIVILLQISFKFYKYCNFNILNRLITCECDKTIKVWKENNEATPETHPIADVKMQFDKF